jgi:hypothetical protein
VSGTSDWWKRLAEGAPECNMGIASWIGEISEKNSVLVEVLLSAGAM